MDLGDPERLETVKDHLRRSANGHSPTFDSFLYNGGTAAVLAATAAATLLPPDAGVPFWVPKVLTGFAALWVGLERALTFGARWRYHLEMRARYLGLINLIDLGLAMDGTPEQQKELHAEIWQEIKLLTRQEAAIPGIDTAATAGE